MNINWQIVGSVALGLLPGLSIAIGILLKIRPELRIFIAKGYSWLQTISVALDQIEKNFDNLPYVNTIDDVVEQIIAELEQAGFKTTAKDREQIQKIAKNNFQKKEGWDVDINTEGFKIDFNKKF